jgi:exodeoxyribonuclease VII large subunit
MVTAPAQCLERARQRFAHTEAIARLLGPEATLKRGYSITSSEAGTIIRSRDEVQPGVRVRTRLADGSFESEVAK